MRDCCGVLGATSPRSDAPRREYAALVGKGFSADILAWGEGRVLKLFHGQDSDATARREYEVTRAVHAAGLPVPAAFEVIEVEGRCGVVFERVEGPSLLEYTQARPWALFDTIRLLAELHARVHRCEAPPGLPSQRARVAAAIEAAREPTEAARQAALRRLGGLPEGTALCHGDFHPGNVLIGPRGPVVIDWDSASRGDPLGDVARTSRLMRTASLPPWSRGYMHLLLRLLRPVMHDAYLRHYLRVQGGPRRRIEAWQASLTVGT